RGLAGGYNSNLFKKVVLETEGKPAVIVPLGKKTVDFFQRKNFDILTTEYAVVEDVEFSQCFDIGYVLADAYRNGEFDELHIIYTKFINMLSQEPSATKVLPITYDPSLADDKSTKSLILYEP
ncbi:MAG: F0F1 ATP synthase subunit gamma, partial [Oscillospiraceae bacterium]